MGKKEEIAAAAASVLQPGETVDATAMAVVGRWNVGKSAALAAVTAIASLGMLSVMTVPKQQPLVLTSKRFLILGVKQDGVVERPEGKIAAEIPRSELRALPARRVMLYHAVDVTDVTGNKLTRMKFGLFDGAAAKQFAEGLGAGLI
ncbi:MAG TPA: hypothetical protein VFL27_06285 [Candidatus Dormibacteraeota bacterium]|nr:hypothetical protein [Candidatus Dormibacteraeota bacterium]